MLNDYDVGSFVADRKIAVTLGGGYTADYSSQSVNTMIKGSMAVKSGTITVDRVTVQ